MTTYYEASRPTSKYTHFNIRGQVYKTVNGQDIHAYIAVPKNIEPGKHPVLVKWHGGAYCTGHALFQDWFPKWMATYIIQNKAILIEPNYRLLPESTGADMREDIADFYTWMNSSLDAILESSANPLGPGLSADLNKVCVAGESAGGTITLLSALSQPMGSIKACIATYPGYLDYESDRYLAGIGGSKLPFGAPLMPPSIFHDHVAGMQPGKILTHSKPATRMGLLLAQAQHGLLKPYFGDDEAMFPLKLINKAKDTEEGKFPYMLIMHGKQDTVIDVEYSEEFVEKANKRFGKGRVELVVKDGEHGFDTELDMDTPWLREALKKPTAIWLGQETV